MADQQAPNAAIFAGASQTRTVNDIVDGKYSCSVVKPSSNTPPPATTIPYKAKGA